MITGKNYTVSVGASGKTYVESSDLNTVREVLQSCGWKNTGHEYAGWVRTKLTGGKEVTGISFIAIRTTWAAMIDSGE